MLQLIRQDLQTSIPLCRYTCNASLEFHTSVSLHLQRISRVPYLRIATPAARLQSCRPLYLHVATPAARLESSMPPCRGASRPPNLNIVTPAARLQSSMPPCRHACSAPPDLHHTSVPSLIRSLSERAPPLVCSSYSLGATGGEKRLARGK